MSAIFSWIIFRFIFDPFFWWVGILYIGAGADVSNAFVVAGNEGSRTLEQPVCRVSIANEV